MAEVEGGAGLVAVVAEKPSVARDIAAVLGATRRGNGSLSGGGYVVTWAIGHLVALPEPQQIRPEWKTWRRDLLPMLPSSWPLVVTERLREQFDAVRAVLTDPRVTEIVCATDAGREGELIFRQLYEAAGATKPVKRLWISSLTPDAIRDGFSRLRPSADFDPLADAARGRSRADWLVGMNFSRAFTIAAGDLVTVGRVQTPTLAMLVEREEAIRAFVPEDYLEVAATFEGETGRYRGTFFDPARREAGGTRFPPGGEEARAVVARALTGRAVVESVAGETRRAAPPLLFDLTELQRHANRRFGWSAKKTLEVAQRLYEEKKAITYPRTDSRHLSKDVAKGLGGLVRAVVQFAPELGALLAPGTGVRPLGTRFVDDAKVTDHHAIVPTPSAPKGLDADERALYDAIARRLLAAWHGDSVTATTTVITAVMAIESPGFVDRYRSSGTVVLEAGWKSVEPDPPKRRKGKGGDEAGSAAGEGAGADEEETLPAGLAAGQEKRVVDAGALSKKTRPPKRFTDATLLTAMETAGRTLDEKELAEAMKENGLGTPATRAEILETLLSRKYAERLGKALAATDKGIAVIAAVPGSVKSPALTGRWEAELNRVRRGEGRLDAFMAGIEAYVREVVAGAGTAPKTPPAASPGGATAVPARAANVPAGRAAPRSAPAASRPVPPLPVGPPRVPHAPREKVPADRLGQPLKEVFGHDAFRPFQEAVCRAVTEGKDALLVMPTGAGKSLCYQLPGIARAGTTLVISPLIALMEDQAARLRALGLAAERIHSGIDRLTSRQVCRDYLDGKLDFLFIAPERLSVPGFPEMLAKRTVALVAVDEAHCISHWGHDFRPDYRLLGARLPSLRPAPVIALTATATPRVQEDVCQQLGMAKSARFIHGFRRTNLAVEVAEAPPSGRGRIVREVLADRARRPAIVYAPTRRDAESLADELSGSLKAVAYHAGMTAKARDEAQRRFLEGRVDVMVATIAFGMGIDKADVRTVLHTGLPASVEGYYQEIGRAGRDGLPSRAVLLHSYSDTKTHEFFFDRDYPDAAILERIFKVLRADAVPSDGVRERAGLVPDEFEKALEKLWTFGGAVVSPEGDVSRGQPGWQRLYEEQREHKRTQLDLMRRFASGSSCRMLQLVRHFGDQEDSGARCGLCDICAPASGVATMLKGPSPMEEAALRRALELLRERDGQGTGQLHRGVVEQFPSIERRTFEDLLGGLARAGAIRIEDDRFEKDGETIRFRRAYLSGAGAGTRGGAAADAAAAAAARIPVAHPSVRAAKKSRLPDLRKKGGPAGGARRSPRRGFSAGREEESEPLDPLVTALRRWRLEEAKKSRLPAFRILTDQTLLSVAARRPATEEELLSVGGIGPSRLRKYGERLLSIVTSAVRGGGRAPR